MSVSQCGLCGRTIADGGMCARVEVTTFKLGTHRAPKRHDDTHTGAWACIPCADEVLAALRQKVSA